MRKINYGLALIVVLAIAVAGCGSDSSTSGGAYSGKGGGGYGGGKESASQESPSAASSAGVVSTAQVEDLGTVLVSSAGLTLYDFHKDQGGKSSCYDACAGAWPPLLTDGEPTVEGDAQSNMLGTTKRKDGTVQVTYNGWPLYTYAGDQNPGEANGNDIDQFGEEWYALQPNAEEPED